MGEPSSPYGLFHFNIKSKVPGSCAARGSHVFDRGYDLTASILVATAAEHAPASE